jgi:hypothetical protein
MAESPLATSLGPFSGSAAGLSSGTLLGCCAVVGARALGPPLGCEGGAGERWIGSQNRGYARAPTRLLINSAVPSSRSDDTRPGKMT